MNGNLEAEVISICIVAVWLDGKDIFDVGKI